jgi:hypothetical protein
LRLTENGACGVLRLCGLKVGSRVLVGDAILELVGLGRKLLLLVGRLLVDGLGGVLWLRAARGCARAVVPRKARKIRL